MTCVPCSPSPKSMDDRWTMLGCADEDMAGYKYAPMCLPDVLYNTLNDNSLAVAQPSTSPHYTHSL